MVKEPVEHFQRRPRAAKAFRRLFEGTAGVTRFKLNEHRQPGELRDIAGDPEALRAWKIASRPGAYYGPSENDPNGEQRMTTVDPLAHLPEDVRAALAAEEAFIANRPTGSRGGEKYDWLKHKAPDWNNGQGKGKSNVYHMLVLPLAYGPTGMSPGVPWIANPRHRVVAQGDTLNLTCPQQYAMLNDPTQSKGPPAPCPICEAAEYMKMEVARQHPRDSEANKEAWQRGVDLSPRLDFFCKALDLDNWQRHYRVDEATKQTTGIIACPYSFGKDGRDAMKANMATAGMFWNPAGATKIQVTATRTGPADMNVERDFRCLQPIGGYVFEHGLEHALSTLDKIDLSALVKLLPPEQLKSFIPAYARRNPQVQVPATPYAAQAATQPLPPPLPVPAATAPAAPPPLPAIPAAAAPPALPTSPALPSAPALPTAPPAAAAPPPLPSLPAAPAAAPAAAPPPLPSLPTAPGLPSLPAVPTGAAPASSAPPSLPSSQPSMPPLPSLPPPPRIG